MREDLRIVERRAVLPDREAGPGRLTVADITRRLAARPPVLSTPGAPLAGLRGDHGLNPGLEPVRPDLTPAAVLVPLVVRAAGLEVLFTRRTEHLAHHAGQISFPGGRLEPGDAGPEDAALRETEEEIGLPRDRVTLIGRLDDYVTRTGFRIAPVIGVARPPFDLRPDDFEVAEVFEVPLDFLLDPANHERHVRAIGGAPRSFFAITHGRHFIWGATAGMIINLCDALREDPIP